MQSSIARHLRAFATLPLIALTLAGACSDSTPTGPVGPGPVLPNAAAFVSVVTTGTNLDPYGYALTVLVGPDTTKHVQVLPNDAVEFGGLALRDYAIILSGIPPSCTSDTLEKTLVPEAPELHSTTSFMISCFGPSVPPNSAGTQLLFVRQGKIYRTTIGSSSVTALTTGEEPTWSPDGSRIAFVRGVGTYVMDENGGNERLVATAASVYATTYHPSEMAPAWSPDGRRLALYSADTIAIVTVDSVGVARVEPPSSCYSDDEGSPTWSPDGTHIVFATGCYSNWIEAPLIEVVSDTNGSSVSDLRDEPPLLAIKPAWSPDGSGIALVVMGNNSSGDRLARIALIDPDGSHERTLVSSRGYSRLAWSPDGKTIAYANTCLDYKCPSAILYVTADGAQNGVLIDDAHSPSWHN